MLSNVKFTPGWEVCAMTYFAIGIAVLIALYAIVHLYGVSLDKCDVRRRWFR
jgi:hypothetical protein